MKTIDTSLNDTWHSRRGIGSFSVRLGVTLAMLSLFIGGLSISAADANPPSGISYQGYLLDSAGDPLADDTPTNFDIKFKIYDAEQNGTLIWSEAQTVTVDNGSFSVLLGEGSAISGEESKNFNIANVFDAVDASDRFVEITVGAGSAIAPRLRLLTSPYAFLASKAIVAEGLSTSSAEGITFNGSDLVTVKQKLQVDGESTLSGGLKLIGSGDVDTTAGGTGLLEIKHDSGDTRLRLDANEIQAVNNANGDAATLHLNNNGGALALGNTSSTTEVKGNPVRLTGGKIELDTTVEIDGETTLVGSRSLYVGGQVGIGTTSPSEKLQVAGNIEAVDVKATGNAFVTGELGVGTTNPQEKLHVSGSGNLAVRIQSTDASGHAWDLGSYGGGAFRIINQGTDGTSDDTRMFIHPTTGYVTIGGDTTPEVPLHVVGSNQESFNLQFYVDGGSATNTDQTRADLSHGILADQRIRARAFDVESDARIKKVLRPNVDSGALDEIGRLHVVEYEMRDPVQDGRDKYRGFLAQEVEHVLPWAVRKSTEVVPDIYQLSRQVHYNAETSRLSIKLESNHGLKLGDQVRLVGESGPLDRQVVQVVSETEFVVGDWAEGGGRVFVYGREVEDFRVLDYDYVFSTGIAAIQEVNRKLDRSNQDLKTEVQVLRTEKEALKGQLSSMAKRMEALEALVAKIEQATSREVVALQR